MTPVALFCTFCMAFISAYKNPNYTDNNQSVVIDMYRED